MIIVQMQKLNVLNQQICFVTCKWRRWKYTLTGNIKFPFSNKLANMNTMSAWTTEVKYIAIQSDY